MQSGNTFANTITLLKMSNGSGKPPDPPEVEPEPEPNPDGEPDPDLREDLHHALSNLVEGYACMAQAGSVLTYAVSCEILLIANALHGAEKAARELSGEPEPG